jgi:putative endonuclease
VSNKSDSETLPDKPTKQWYVYLLRCVDNSLYTGVTTDPERRLKEHNGEFKGKGKGKGAKYTRARRPVSLAIAIPLLSKVAVYQAEYAIKRLSKREKESIVGMGLDHPLFERWLE